MSMSSGMSHILIEMQVLRSRKLGKPFFYFNTLLVDTPKFRGMQNESNWEKDHNQTRAIKSENLGFLSSPI